MSEERVSAGRTKRGKVAALPEPNEQVQALLQQLALVGLPKPVLEHRFHTERAWRFDLAWLRAKVACEVEGGVWMQTRTGRGKGHAHPKRFIEDCHKYNEAALAGWTLIRVTPEMIRDGQAIEWLLRALRGENHVNG